MVGTLSRKAVSRDFRDYSMTRAGGFFRPRGTLSAHIYGLYVHGSRVYPVPVQRLEGHPEAKRLTCGVVAFGLQQYAKVVDGGKRVLMPVAEGLAQPLYRLAVQWLSGGEVALVPQQHAEVVDGGERVWMPAAESLTLPLQRLSVQHFSGGEVALVLQQRAEVVEEAERTRVPVAEGPARHLQRLAVHRLGGGEVALGLQ